jgi:nucleoside-diphosphate-sugar epimerase
MENIRDILGEVEFVEGDIRDEKTVRKAVKGIKYVLHLAALPSVARSVEDPMTSNEVNTGGSLKLLIAARDEGVARFVFSSSSSVYGDTPELPKREDMLPNPLSPYAAQKLAGEHYCRMFHRLYGLRTFALRYFNVFGPRQNPKSQYAAVIPIFISRVMEGKAVEIHGDGNQTRDFTYVDDVVNANLCCCFAADRAAGGVYNVARGDRVSIAGLAACIGRLLGKKVKIRHTEQRPGDVRDSQADSSRASAMLGWKSGIDFEQGMLRTVEYFTRKG